MPSSDFHREKRKKRQERTRRVAESDHIPYLHGGDMIMRLDSSILYADTFYPRALTVP